MKRKTFLYVIGILLVSLCFFMTGCSSDPATEVEDETIVETTGTSSSEVDKSDAIKVVMEVNGGKKVEIELYPEVAPETVENFVKLVNSGFYNGLTFHRVIPGFMIQGGDPTATGMGGSDETIVGEFASNGFENNLEHERGVISMARSSDPNSASSQFFIMVEDAPYLDGDYAAFGEVVSGMEYVDEIVSTETDTNDKPLQNQVIDKIYVVNE